VVGRFDLELGRMWSAQLSRPAPAKNGGLSEVWLRSCNVKSHLVKALQRLSKALVTVKMGR
jgi:hypothetical protein